MLTYTLKHRYNDVILYTKKAMERNSGSYSFPSNRDTTTLNLQNQNTKINIGISVL